ncbi:fimbria/pilus outer membrane usher protein [Pseudoalteromonas obscura]|uniref:Fimbria/pilus outer membrane usher protein n=1 Tax=Pseudoalteromonas obscura TaxID=3048491 RepID=A0ABT7EM20_9GAMM|nr:fimbria/pilus outer membrane usher protein [Pseudoalteromonas sp. P94(2023)]MDK2596096.1 fimbria/pilus outer membrane usher protein [Pseudoalteromonas sp. P94(2023)]
MLFLGAYIRPIDLKCVLYALLLFWVSNTLSATFEMDFPVRLHIAEIGQVSAATDGIELKSIAATEFKDKMQSVLSEEILAWLTELGDTAITPAEFSAKGIELTLQPQDLTIEMSLSEAAMATDSLSYGRQKHFELPEGEAKWAVLNNLNLNHERTNNNHDHRSQLEWLIDANIGGGDGINMNSSVFWENGNQRSSKVYRGETAFYYDQPDKPLRYTLGDTSMNSAGHLPGAQLAGFSIEKAYSKLQPQRRITPGNSQQFVLPRAALLEVYINDFLISRLRLKAGRYDLSDLPLTSGENNIHVVATYPNGEKEDFYFTTHYNARLLAKGLSDYSLSVGYLSSLEDQRFHYDDDLIISGTYEYGLSDSFTFGFNGAVHPRGHVLGTLATINSPIGNLSLRYSQSEVNGTVGSIYSLETEHSIFGHGNVGSPNFRLGYEISHDFTSSPWLEFDTRNNRNRAFVDYSYFINEHMDLNFNATRAQNDDNFVTDSITAEFNVRYETIRLRMGYNHTQSEDDRIEPDNQFFLNFTWNYDSRENSNRARAQYNSRTKVSSASYAKTNHNFVNDYGYQVLAEQGEDFRQEQLEASYTGAFVRADISANNHSRFGIRSDSSASVNLSTSLGVADGHFGMGATTTAPFAVVTKHNTLKDADVLINVDRTGRAQTKPSNQIGALIDLGNGYSKTQLNIDVPDAPLGYDWGPGIYVKVGGAATGHHIQIGSDLSYTIIGTLVDDKGTPIAMKRGRIVKQQNAESADPQAQSWPFFTNRAGRFVVEGISLGHFDIELNNLVGQLNIADTEQRFVRIGKVVLKPAQPKGGAH